MRRTHGSDWFEHKIVAQVYCSGDERPIDIERKILIESMLDHRERRGYCQRRGEDLE